MSLDDITLETLTSADPRTLGFGPLGLGGSLPLEIALDHQRSTVTRFSLASNVGEQTQRAVGRLQLTHLHGLLCYEMYSIADTNSWLVLDLALAERFLDFYAGSAPFVVGHGPNSGQQRPLTYRTWDDVYTALHEGTHRDRALLLQPLSGRKSFRFTGHFNSLLQWARTEDLLHGQRNRRVEPVYQRFRNDAAHPRFTGTAMPVESARSIRDLIEIVNQLWGHRTPGGRLYPGPLRRSTVIIGWDDVPNLTWFELPALEHAELAVTRFIAVSAVPDDDVRFYDSLHETTTYPTELLWGPGTEAELREWVTAGHDSADSVDYLDRLFLVRVAGADVEQPMRPTIAAGLPASERAGHWHLVRADYPSDAYAHVRSFTHPSVQDPVCRRVGPCPNCAVDVIGTGRLDSMIRWLRANGNAAAPERPRRVAVPSPV